MKTEIKKYLDECIEQFETEELPELIEQGADKRQLVFNPLYNGIDHYKSDIAYSLLRQIAKRRRNEGLTHDEYVEAREYIKEKGYNTKLVYEWMDWMDREGKKREERMKIGLQLLEEARELIRKYGDGKY